MLPDELAVKQSRTAAAAADWMCMMTGHSTTCSSDDSCREVRVQLASVNTEIEY